MFGIDDAIMAAGIQAGGSLLGGMMGATGAANTNAAQIQANAQAQSQAQQFNAWQSDESRRFSGAQAENQMVFQDASQNKAMAFNAEQAELNRRFAGQQAENQMVYQTGMSNSAYQRAMADMRAAGLNPILAANLGGASTPGGAAGAGSSASISGMSGAAGSGAAGSSSGISSVLKNPGEALMHGVQSAAGAAMNVAAYKDTMQRVETGKSQADLNAANESYAKANSALNEELQKRARQETTTSAAQQRLNDAAASNQSTSAMNNIVQNQILQHDVTSAAEKARLATIDRENRERAGAGWPGDLVSTVGRTIGYIGRSAREAVDPVIKQTIETFKNRNTEVPATSPAPATSAGPRLLRDDPSHWLYQRR